MTKKLRCMFSGCETTDRGILLRDWSGVGICDNHLYELLAIRYVDALKLECSQKIVEQLENGGKP